MPAPKQRLQVKEAPYPVPGPDEVVVKTGAVAINPIDWIMQDQGTSLMFGWIKYPFIFGHDVAGEVVQVGNKVTRFQVGDRVMGQGLSTDSKINSASHGAFQCYTVLVERNTCPIPDSLSFEAASVIPLGLATASAGLFEEGQLGLQHPRLGAEPTGKIVLVWGGSTSVGCNAIQLAAAAGYEVFATCSPNNFHLLLSLGASKVFDYKDPTVVTQIVKAMAGKESVGAMAIGEKSIFFCLDVLRNCRGRKHIAIATFPIPSQPKRFALLQILYGFITSMISITVKSTLWGVKTSIIYGSVAYSPVGDAVYVSFLPGALASGKFRATPEPLVMGHGLEAIQEALESQRRGVSAKKVVVTLG
jgi:NADPH:quinone reductase-like Zn-dependent oxidoreductase